jgi:hypothetical protein
MGNTTITDARQVLAGQTSAMVRLDANLLLHGNESEIDRIVADIFNESGDWKNLLIILPCGRAPLDNIRRVVDQVYKLSR